LFGEIKLNAVHTKLITLIVIFVISAFAIAVSADEVETEYTIHKMQKGESLWRLSVSNYGTSRYAYLLAEYNNIKDVQRIQIDQEIRIPKVFSYEVKAGDTLSKISRRLLGDSRKYKDLAEYNDISNPNLILKGSKLEIPLKPNIDFALAENRLQKKSIPPKR
jgi:nucleoid-associated protein YgaU